MSPDRTSSLAAELFGLCDRLADWPELPYGSWIGEARSVRRNRCEAVKGNGRRCKRPARRGRRRCRFHGGRKLSRGVSHLPVCYSSHIAPTLAERLRAFLEDGDRREQLLLYREIALARVRLTQAIELVTALEYGMETRQEGITPEMVAMARSSERSHLELVSDLCQRCASIEKTMSDKVSVQQLGYFVEQLTTVIHKRLGDTPEARQLADDLRDRVRLPLDQRIDPESEIVVEIDLGGKDVRSVGVDR